MDRHFYNKGFTLVEVALIIFIFSVLYFLIPKVKYPNFESHLFVFDYLYLQSLSIANANENQLSVNSNEVYFNDKGNVRNAQTMSVGDTWFISQLGGGRLVEK